VCAACERVWFGNGGVVVCCVCVTVCCCYGGQSVCWVWESMVCDWRSVCVLCVVKFSVGMGE